MAHHEAAMHALPPATVSSLGCPPHRLHDELVGRLGRGCKSPTVPDCARRIKTDKLHLCAVVEHNVAIALHDQLHCPVGGEQGRVLHWFHRHAVRLDWRCVTASCGWHVECAIVRPGVVFALTGVCHSWWLPSPLQWMHCHSAEPAQEPTHHHQEPTMGQHGAVLPVALQEVR